MANCVSVQLNTQAKNKDIQKKSKDYKYKSSYSRAVSVKLSKPNVKKVEISKYINGGEK